MKPTGLRRLCAILVLPLLVSMNGESAAAEADRSPLTAGCGLPPEGPPPASLIVNGRTRSLITSLPMNYDPQVAHSLIIAIHGRTNSNSDVRSYFDLERHAAGPTIFAYPSGHLKGGRAAPWTDPGDRGAALRDYALIDRLIDELSSRYCLNDARIFAVGHSLGAWFVNSLGCARADRFRAIASVAGGVSPSDCAGRIAALILHNPKDRLVPHREAERARDLLLQANGFDREGKPVEPSARHCLRFGPDDTAHPVVWCPHREDITWRGRFYPHQWPRGTGEQIMRFFGNLP